MANAAEPTSSNKSLSNKVLLAIEWATISAGVVATIAVFVQSYSRRPKPEADLAATVMAATSTCDGGKGTRAILRAWVDGAELPGEPTAPEPTLDDALRTRGAQLFATTCFNCHGPRGDGKGPLAATLDLPPADLTIGTYALRTTEHEALPTDLDLFRTISRGIHGTAMPPWFELPERDRWALVAYVKSLSKAFTEDEAPPPVDIGQPPEATPARIEHGRQLFASSGCASCHGAEGRGDGPAGTSLTTATGWPLKPRDFTKGRFHRGSRTVDIYTSLVTGFDGTPMASFVKVLGPDDLWDLAMFVHELAPAVVDQPGGMRCRTSPATTPNADELVGLRTILRTLPPTH